MQLGQLFGLRRFDKAPQLINIKQRGRIKVIGIASRIERTGSQSCYHVILKCSLIQLVCLCHFASY